MTTPDTSAVRAWARENGYEVADRGRLPAGVTGAYLAATAKGDRTKPAPARKAAAVKAAPPPQPVEQPAPAAPKPSPVNDDRRLVALGEELAALAKRVEALEAAAGKSSKPGGGKTGRFRRRS